MDVYICRVPLRHLSDLNSRRAAILFGRLVVREVTWEAHDNPKAVLPQNWDGVKLNRTVNLMVFKAMDNDRGGRNSRVIKVCVRGWQVTSSSPVPLKARRVGERCALNMSRAQTSTRGVLVRRGRWHPRCHPLHLTMAQNYEVRQQKRLVLLNIATLIFTHSFEP
ncbi:hypothetical protein TNCV_3669901 [Trichonephila clavipes]|nr:hypothetical protein TNCV_3669901 [Trichonephila clavipes]